MAEIGTGLIGLSPRQMWRSVSTSARMFSRATLAEMKSIGSKIPGTKITPKSRIDLVKSDDDFTRVAMTGVVTGSDAATLESTNTSTGAYKKATKLLYIVNQVEKQTASFRGGRGALAWDKIIDHILHVNNDFILGNVTQQGRYSRDMLNSYGLDVDFLVDYFNKLDNKSEQSLRSVEDRVRRLYGKEKEILQRYRTTPLSQFETMAKNEESDAAEVKLLQQYRIGVTNFTDELSVRPKKGDAPKLIEDPRFYLFTQYKRFAATFTANIMPTVWQNYIRRGPPGMTFATFSVIMGTYWLAMVSQLLKDLMVYGEKSPWLDEGEDPDWIDTEEFRAASYTGWLGTPGMAIEAIDRFNEKSMYTPILTNLGEAIVNQSPSLNAIYTNVKKGDENLQERVAKYTPFIGSIKPAREALANADLINFYKE